MAKWTPVDYPVGPLAGPSAEADRPAPPTGSGTDLTHPLTLLLKGAGALRDVMDSPQVRTRLPHAEIEYAPGAAPTPPNPMIPPVVQPPPRAPEWLPVAQSAPPVPTVGPEIPDANDDLFGRFVRAGMRGTGLPPDQADRLAGIFRLFADKAWRDNSLAGTAVTNIESGVNESPEALRRLPPGSSPYLGFTPPRRPGEENYMSFRPPEVQDRIAERSSAKKAEYENQRAVKEAQTRALGPLTPVEQVMSIFSSMIGGMASPESAIGPARAAYSSASTLGKIALGAGTNAAVVAPSDLIAQESAVARGDRKEINPKETALATGGAALLGGLIPAIASLFKRAGALRPGEAPPRDAGPPALDGEIIPPAPPGTPRLPPPEPGQPARAPESRETRVRMRDDAPPELPAPVRQIEGQRALPAPDQPARPVEAQRALPAPERPAEPATGPAIEPASPQPEVRVDADGATIIRLPPPPEKPAKPAVAEAPAVDAQPARAPASSRSSLDNQGTVGDKTGMESPRNEPVPEYGNYGPYTNPHGTGYYQGWTSGRSVTRQEAKKNYPEFTDAQLDLYMNGRELGVKREKYAAPPTRAADQPPDVPDFLKRTPQPMKEEPRPAWPPVDAPQPPRVEPVPKAEAPQPPANPARGIRNRPIAEQADHYRATDRRKFVNDGPNDQRGLTEYFTPGRVVPAYGGRSQKVLSFDWQGDGKFNVRTRDVDPKTGEFKPDSVERTHSTRPTWQEVRKAADDPLNAPKVEGPRVEPAPKAEGAAPDSARVEIEVGKEATYNGRKEIEFRSPIGSMEKMDARYVVQSEKGAKATDEKWHVERRTGEYKYGVPVDRTLTPNLTKKEAIAFARRAAQDELDSAGRSGFEPTKYTNEKYVKVGDPVLFQHGADQWRLGRAGEVNHNGVVVRADVGEQKYRLTQGQYFRMGEELRSGYEALMKRHGDKTWGDPKDARAALQKWKDETLKGDGLSKDKAAKQEIERRLRAGEPLNEKPQKTGPDTSDHPFSKDSKPTEMNLGLPIKSAIAKAVGPEAIGALVGGGLDHWNEHGYPGLTVRGMIAGAAAVAAIRHRMPGLAKPVFGKTSYAKDALGAVGDVIGKTRAGRWFHPTMGLPKDLWDRIVVQTGVETRNIQEAAKAVARHIRENFTPAERALMSDWIERAEQQAHGMNAFRAADARTRAQADALSAKADEIGQKLVDVGMLDQRSYDALKGAYLHRYYLPKQEADPGFREAAKRMQATATYSLRRGESAEFDAKGLKVGDTAVQWTNAQSGNVTYRPAGQTPGADWFPSKEFKVEFVRDGRAVGHRDYTPAEREAMGEIRDANYRYTMGMMEAARDVALGSMFKDIAANPRWASQSPQPGWVPVPTTNVQGSSVRKFGALAGMHVKQEVWDALQVVRKPWTNTDSEAWNNLAKSYTKALGLWKVGKTAYNPATHFNNVMGNVSLSMLTGETTPAFVMRAIGQLRQAKRGGSAVIDEAKAAGLSLDREAHLGDAIDNLKADVGITAGMDPRSGWAKFADWYTNNGIVRAYQYEDSIFKLGSYMKNRAEGLSPREAVAKTHKVFFDYSDVPLGVQAVRDTYSPFFTYTYKYGQLLANIVAEKPWALLAAFGTLTAAHQMSYYHLYGERAKANADYEAELMPKWLEGRSGFGAPKGIRLPWNEKDTVTGEPRSQFLNSRYMIPGGDFLDFTANGSFGPAVWPQMLGNTILGGNPLVNFAYSALSGKDSYFDKSIYPYKDPVNAGELVADAGTIIRFAAAQALPPILMSVPDKLGNAAVGEGALDKNWMTEAMGWTGTDFAGRQRSIIRAIGSALGVKVEDVNTSENLDFKEAEAKKGDRDANTEVRRAYNNESMTETRRLNLERSAEDRANKSDAELDRIYKLKKAAGR